MIALLLACRDPGPATTVPEPEETGTSTDGAQHSAVTGPTGDTGTTAAHTGHTAAPAPGSWEVGTPTPVPIQEIAVVALGGEVVTLGGFTVGGLYTNLAFAYEPTGGTWRRLPDLPARMHHAQAAVVDGVVYVLGFLGPDFDEDGSVWAFDPAVGTWEPRRPMPAGTERGGGAAVVLDGRIHVVGGLRRPDAVGDHTAYDPATDTWEVLTPLPTPRDHLGAGVVDGRIYAVGGRVVDADAPMAVLEVYDPSTDAWTSGPPMPTARGGMATAVADGRLYAFGGEGNALDPSGVFPQVEVYLPGRGTWATLAPMATPRHGTGAAVVDGKVWIPGGAVQQSLAPVVDNEAFVP